MAITEKPLLYPVPPPQFDEDSWKRAVTEYINTEVFRRSRGRDYLTQADQGSGNGLDADTVDSLEASQFLRSDLADTAEKAITFDSGLLLPNLKSIGLGDNTGLSYFYALYMTSGNVISLGNPNFPLTIVNNGTLLANSDTIWTSGNDGTGSGLDADTVDGMEASAFWITKNEVADSNSVTISAIDTTTQTIVDLDLGSLSASEVIEIDVQLNINAPNSATDTFILEVLKQTGTATLAFGEALTQVAHSTYLVLGNGETGYVHLRTTARVTSGGTVSALRAQIKARGTTAAKIDPDNGTMLAIARSA